MWDGRLAFFLEVGIPVSANQGSWVITSFAASNAIILPLTGWLSDYFGRVRLFVFSVLFFALASFLCGLATNLTFLIIFRALQGAAAGSLIPLSQSLIITNNPPKNRGSVLGFWVMIVITAPIFGPVIGGYITQEYSWPWIFFINVPLCLFSALSIWRLLKDQEDEIVRNPIDWRGLFLLVTGVACLQIMLDRGHDQDWFDSQEIIILAVISAICLMYFGIWNASQPYPIIDFSFFKNRNFAIGTLLLTVGFGLYFASTILIPLWLQTQQNFTPMWAGLALAPVGIFPFFSAFFIGKNLHRVDLRLLSAFSFVMLAASFFYQARFTPQVDLLTLMGARLLQGVGVAFFFLPLLQLSLGEISKARYASASGLCYFVRILFGSGFGTSLSIEFWFQRATIHHAYLAETFTGYQAHTIELWRNFRIFSSQFNSQSFRYILDKMIDQQAYTISLNEILWLSGCGLLALTPLLFLCKPVRSAQADMGVME